MRSTATDSAAFFRALHERTRRTEQEVRVERAEEVKADYVIEAVGSLCWVVVHPDEPDRAYTVDMLKRVCNCPDYQCTAAGLEILCKHIISVIPLWEQLTGVKYAPNETPKPDYASWFVAIQDPDPDDVYKD